MSQQLAIAEQPLPRGPYRDYTPEFKADTLLALTVNNGNIYKTAKDAGIATSLLRYWIETDTDEQREIRQGRKGELAEEFEHVSRVYLDRALEPEAIAKTTGYYAVVAASDAMKSAQLLRGLPTSITANVGRDDIDSFLASSLADVIDVTPVTPGSE